MASRNSARFHTKNKACIIGSGNWATAIASVIASNITRNSSFEETVNIWVFDEKVTGDMSLADYMNKYHENIKYLPKHELPPNLVAFSRMEQAAKHCNFIFLVVPNNFLLKVCKTLVGKTRTGAHAIALVRFLDRMPEGGGVPLVHNFVTKYSKIECSVFTGIGLASQIVKRQYCDITLASADQRVLDTVSTILQNDFVRVTKSDDVGGVELCVGLRNIVAFVAGCFDGFVAHENYKALAVRIGIMDIIRYLDFYHSKSKLHTFFQTCGIPEMIVSCYGCRARRMGEVILIKKKFSPLRIERTIIMQFCPGPRLVTFVYAFLRAMKKAEKFPSFITAQQYLKYRERDIIWDLVKNTFIDVVHPHSLTPF